MPQLFCTGPAHIYVAPTDLDSGATASTSPLYLGTAEGAPQIEITPHYTPVMNDLGGQALPIDWMFDGEEGLIVADLTRWNEAVYAAIVARPKMASTTRGVYGATDLGSLLSTESLTMDAWVQFPYQTKSAYSAMPPGYHFFSCFCLGPDTINPGTRASKRRVILKAMRYLNPTDSTWKLYDTSMTSIPSVPPTSATGTGSASS